MANITSTKTFAPAGCCIYCGDKGGPLSDEHVIAFALGGNLILPKASCRGCAKETGRVEQTCCKVMYNPLCYKKNMPTRRPRERPTEIQMWVVEHDGKTTIRSVTVQDYPDTLAHYAFDQARILGGWPYFKTGKILAKPWIKGPIGSDLSRLARKPKAKGYVMGNFDPLALSRMLAKIGYSYAVAKRGYGNFTPLATELILGRDDEIGHLVGGKIETDLAPTENLHELNVCEYRVESQCYLVVEIRLFANIGAPQYHAVVGLL